jgi:hypothetical protein
MKNILNHIKDRTRNTFSAISEMKNNSKVKRLTKKSDTLLGKINTLHDVCKQTP